MQASQLSGEQGAGHEPQTGARAGPCDVAESWSSAAAARDLPSGSSACRSAHRRSGADRCRRWRGLRSPASRHLRRGARVSATRGPRARQGQPVQLLPPGQPRMDDAGLRDARRRFARSASRPAARGRSRRAVRLHGRRLGTRRFRRRHAGAGPRRHRAVPGLDRPGRTRARLVTRPRPNVRSLLRRLSQGDVRPGVSASRARRRATPQGRDDADDARGVPCVVRGADETDTRGATERRRRVDAGLR